MGGGGVLIELCITHDSISQYAAPDCEEGRRRATNRALGRK